jgi:hypothetical protein
VTFKELKKRVSLELPEQQSIFFERLQNKPFWIWNVEDHKKQDVIPDVNCCFNHIIDLPHKDAVEKPLYEYEKIILESLAKVAILILLINTSARTP